MDVPTGEPGRAHEHDAYASERLPEPTFEPAPGTGPAAPVTGGSLRASDADRDQVAALLSAAYAEGRLTHEEHDERLAAVLVARTFADLIPLTTDLVPLDPAPATVSSATPPFVVGGGTSTEVDRMVAVFGGVERKGRWRMAARNQIIAVFGGTEVKNVGEPVEGAPTLVIKGNVFFGGVSVKGPRSTIFGRGTARPGLAALDPRPERTHQRGHGGGH